MVRLRRPLSHYIIPILGFTYSARLFRLRKAVLIIFGQFDWDTAAATEDFINLKESWLRIRSAARRIEEPPFISLNKIIKKYS